MYIFSRTMVVDSVDEDDGEEVDIDDDGSEWCVEFDAKKRHRAV